MQSNPTQFILSREVEKQLAALQADGTLDAAVPALEDAVFRQFNNNYTFSRDTTSDLSGLCSGSFWWRYNKAPCDRRYNYLN